MFRSGACPIQQLPFYANCYRFGKKIFLKVKVFLLLAKPRRPESKNVSSMLVLSAGMPKSGSTLLSFYQKSILEHAMAGNGQQCFEQRIRDGKINGAGFFVHNIETPEVLNELILLSEDIGPFVVKAHVPLTAEIRNGILAKRVLATYIHRDPRDVILSAIDHGKRQTKNPALNVFFRRLTDVDQSVPLVREYCRIGLEWIQSGLCEVFTYPDLLANPHEIMQRFCDLMSMPGDKSLFNSLVQTYTVDQVKGRRQFNTGKLTRYREEMTPEDLSLCNRELKTALEQMGYPV
jgi:hypothetical protein